jgi:hypothetical protein
VSEDIFERFGFSYVEREYVRTNYMFDDASEADLFVFLQLLLESGGDARTGLFRMEKHRLSGPDGVLREEYYCVTSLQSLRDLAAETGHLARTGAPTFHDKEHSPLRSGADLDGKIVGVTTLDGEQQLGAEVWVDKTGGNSKTVRFVELSETTMAAALVAGRIDAAMMTGSYVSQARNDIELLGNADAAIAPRFISGAFFAATQWVQAQPDTARRVARALRDTAHWANTHRADTGAILARNSDLDAPTIAAMVRSTFAESISVPELEPAIDVGLTYGRLKAPLDLRQIVATAQSFFGR